MLKRKSEQKMVRRTQDEIERQVLLLWQKLFFLFNVFFVIF